MENHTAPFLHEVAEALLKQGKNPDAFTIVFPNRRSALYFRKHLSGFFTKPVFGPELLTLEDFIAGLVQARIPERLQLVYRLYKAYVKVTGWDEPFDSFYYWGSMLLRDFDEIDKHLVNPDHIFKDLSNQKELDAAFDYLTDEQKKFLNNFWSGFADSHTAHRTRFIELWRHLSAVYHAFQENLRNEHLTYEGRLYRDVAERIHAFQPPARQLVFVGFNALTTAQEKIITHAITQWNALIFWDIDEYYVHSEWQEAGLFFRTYKAHPVLARTFPADVPAHFRRPKQLKIFGAPQATGQAKILAQALHEALQNGMHPDDAVIVLPDEKLLLPVLHAISDQVKKLNVSVSYPLRLTPVVSLVEQIASLHTHYSKETFGTKQVLALLSHPYLRAICADEQRGFIKEITRNNCIRLSASVFRGSSAIIQQIFRPVQPDEIVGYLSETLQMLAGQDVISQLDREYIAQTRRLLLELVEIPEVFTSWDAFMLIFRQLINETRIPFAGEPLQGLPVIGMLETRNLDFKYVFILSVNEGALPPFRNSGSYLPYSLRKAYGLPVAGHDEAISAYLFYRLMQRASHVTMLYTTEPDELGRGEMSRFLQQLLLESAVRPQPVIVTNPLQPHPVYPVSIEKTDEVWQQLMERHNGNWKGQGLTPTALFSYLACRLQFYFRYVLGIREAAKIEEDIDARLSGTVLHDTMELFYKGLAEKKGSNLVEPEDLKESDSRLRAALDEAFRKAYGLAAAGAVVYEGSQLILMEVINRFAQRVIELDRDYAPFEILGTERGDFRYRFKVPHTNLEAEVGGKIDRIDQKNDTVRIIDYKTGRDELKFKSLEELFARDRHQGKAEFQVLLYALLFARSYTGHGAHRIVPGIMGRKQIFGENFDFGLAGDVRPMLHEFEARLKEMVGELFNRDIPFSQTANLETCKYCAYKQICHR
jgi:RecB family exonuclease/RNAse (barnase) inhibitor barstar